ncbi:MAG TPA: CsgG/HfaB family protein [Candidatus Udaeobacter sp.]|nr:CsgG/HfaB family protein [Candidatus Udaeobacter sp.]
MLAAAGLTAAGCASAVQEWVKPGAGRAGRVAVLAFENQTTSLRAGQSTADLLVTELLATGAIAVMDPSEVADLLRRENLDPADAGRLPSAQRIGRLLQVSHVLQGSVTEYRYKPGLSETPAVGVTARLVEVASGEVVWSASHARLGSSCSPSSTCCCGRRTRVSSRYSRIRPSCSSRCWPAVTACAPDS